MQDIVALKEQVLGIIRIQGPVLPVQVSKEIGSDTMFVGAIFSELLAENKIKISKAKVGGSPLYYMEGQETKLDRLYEYLPGKEKEAYNLLKKNRVLVDAEQEPGIRVALRNLKDFAKPIEKDGVIFWRWYLINDAEAGLLMDRIKPKVEVKKVEQKKIIPLKKVVEKVKAIVKEPKVDDFLEQVKKFLLDKDIKILEEKVIRKNSDIEMKVRVPSNFGDLEFFLKAKNKKRVNDGDLSLAHSKGQKYKMPSLFVSNGNLTKKAEKYMNENLRGYVIFRKL